MRVHTPALSALLVLASLVWAAPGLAAPASGIGAYAGLAAHAYEARLSPDNRLIRYQSAGLSVAGDMQFVITPEWSLNPAVALSAESVSGDITGSASNGLATIQARRWFGNNYLGAQVGAYVTLLSTGSQSGTRYGPGFGAAAGHEGSDGWSYEALVDYPFGTDIQVAVRLHLGYRWR